MHEITDLLEKIETTVGTNAKTEVLYELLRIPDGERFIRIAHNDTLYGVSTRSFEKIVNYDEQTDGVYFDAGELIRLHASKFASWRMDDVVEFLDKLSGLSGNSQLSYLQAILKIEPLLAKWVVRAILKDLKMGISLITINKALKQMGKSKIEKFEVQLAGKFDDIRDPKIQELVGFPCYATIKYDGERGFLIKKDNLVKFVSRQGKLIDYVPELLDHFKNYDDDFTLDGEIMCKDFSTLQKRIGRKDNFEEVEGLHFRLFDILTHNNSSFIKSPQKSRTELLQSFKETNFLKQEERIMVESYEQLIDFYKLAVERGEEGIILKKLHATYDYGSRKNWWKVKPVYEATFQITGKKLGTGKYSGLISTIYVEDKSGEITSGVGSGLTENDILLLMNLEREGKLIGTCVDVAYNEITVDKTGRKSLRFPRVLKIRHDKSEPDKLGDESSRVKKAEQHHKLTGYF